MDKKLITLAIIIILAGTGLVLYLKGSTNPPPPEDGNQTGEIILFYGNGCPHCAKVEEFIQEYKVKDKIPLVEKEIYYNSLNNADFKEKAKSCNLPPAGIGVPLLWHDSNKCLVGDVDIINFFKQKLNEF